MAMKTPGRTQLETLILLVQVGLLGCASGSTGNEADAPTFNNDVAPIVFGNCSVCHRPGESAPFDLLSYRDVEKRARQVMEVTTSRFMPPWLPSPGAHTFLGERRLSEDQIATIRRGAIEQFRAVLGEDPAFVQARINLGNALLARGNIETALDHLRRAVELQPSLDEAHYNLAIALATAGELDEAIVYYRKAIDIEPRFAMAHNNLGAVLHTLERVDEAMTHYRQALELEPSIAEAHNNLGLAYRDRGEREIAVEHFRRALEIDPDFALARGNLEATTDSR